MNTCKYSLMYIIKKNIASVLCIKLLHSIPSSFKNNKNIALSKVVILA